MFLWDFVLVVFFRSAYDLLFSLYHWHSAYVHECIWLKSVFSINSHIDGIYSDGGSYTNRMAFCWINNGVQCITFNFTYTNHTVFIRNWYSRPKMPNFPLYSSFFHFIFPINLYSNRLNDMWMPMWTRLLLLQIWLVFINLNVNETTKLWLAFIWTMHKTRTQCVMLDLNWNLLQVQHAFHHKYTVGYAIFAYFYI